MKHTNKTVDFNIAAQLAEDTEQRRLMYLILSRLYFMEVTAEQLDQMRLEEHSFEGYLEGFQELLQKNDTETLRRELAADFAALFLGLSAHPVAPYESVYTSEEKLLMQDARDAVVREYQSESLLPSKIQGADSVPEDHISFELEYMAALCQKPCSCSQSDGTCGGAYILKKQLNFLEEHLLKWVPKLCDDVFQRARTSFYQSVAAMTKDFLKEEKEYLEAALSCS